VKSACRLTHDNKEPTTLIPTDLTRTTEHEGQRVHRWVFELVHTLQLRYFVNIPPYLKNSMIYYRMSNRQNSIRSRGSLQQGMRLRGYRRHGGECCFLDLGIVLKLVLGLREVTNSKMDEKRRVLWRLQRRPCHDRVAVMLLAGTEVSVDWERFPHFLRVRRGVGVRGSLSTRLCKQTLAAAAHRAGCDRYVVGYGRGSDLILTDIWSGHATTEWTCKLCCRRACNAVSQRHQVCFVSKLDCEPQFITKRWQSC